MSALATVQPVATATPRQPYRPTAFAMMVRSIADRCRLLAIVARIPLNTEAPYVVTIQATSKNNTAGQKRCYWSLIHREAARTGEFPYALHCEVIKLYLPERAHLLLDPTADITKDLDLRAYATLIDGAMAHLASR